MSDSKSESHEMTKRKWILVAGLGIIIVVFVAIWWSFQPRHNITFDAYQKIQTGMTLKEVETLLGAESGDYQSALGRRLADHRRRYCSISLKQLSLVVFVDGRSRTMKIWKSDETTITVWFDNGRVSSTHAAISPFQYENVADYLWNLLSF